MNRLLLLSIIITIEATLISSLKIKALDSNPAPIYLLDMKVKYQEEKVSQILKPISLDLIFQGKSYESNSNEIILLATGDIMLGRTVNSNAVKKNNFTFLFDDTKELLQNADITLINLEGPLVENCPIKTDGMIFCGDLRNIDGLRESGVDIVNLANNHSTNYDEEGLLTTIETIEKNGLSFTGISGPSYKGIKNTTFAFLGYNDIQPKSSYISNIDEEKMKSEILLARSKADIVVVQFHWGVEYQHQPSSRQVYFGRLAIDSGADIVIGNHPHWIQPIEQYKNKIITYSHGNFVFDQFWSEETRKGIVTRYTFTNKKLTNFEVFPIYIDYPGSPRIVDGIEGKAILDNLEKQNIVLSKNNQGSLKENPSQ